MEEGALRPAPDESGIDLQRAGVAPQGRRLLVLSLAALGVVYGDIGTSPLYAIRESFHESYGLEVARANILGVLSLIVWSLVLVISVKYLVFVLRADNRGEGGILALTSLVTPLRAGRKADRWALVVLGLFGAALLYGDGMITPAISVLSAVEGLQIATPVFRPYVVPITVVILIALFLFQRRGTAGVGRVFGPVTLVWFITLAALGIYQIAKEPAVLAALSPLPAIDFFVVNGGRGFLVLGSVFLVVTGGEALYADMGHFGRRPIRLAWFALVLPALLLNYFGQGALLIRSPGAIENPFYRMAPGWATYPMVVIATAATVIASQAVISGSFSLAMQSVQFGYSPRLDIQHTSASEIGQIYIPAVNWALMIACIGLVLGFGSSSNLAAAYGVAVTTTMVITTILFYQLARRRWKWRWPVAAGVAGFFMVIDLSFWGANLVKIPDGGWFPLLVAAVVFTLMTTWKAGRQILATRLRAAQIPVPGFIESITARPPTRVRGTAIFMSSDPDGTPPALLHNLKHNRILHEQVVLLAVSTEEIPHVAAADRAIVTRHENGFFSIELRYGFMEDVNVPRELERLDDRHGIELKPMETTYFLGGETLVVRRGRGGLATWRARLFAVMSRNARNATSFFRLPPNRVVELGAQVEI
jgi:KUP system potassium uptake protein